MSLEMAVDEAVRGLKWRIELWEQFIAEANASMLKDDMLSGLYHWHEGKKGSYEIVCDSLQSLLKLIELRLNEKEISVV